MAKNAQHLSHIKSKIVENGLPKLPSADAIVEGEIAINYAKGYETLSIKNESGDVVTFSSDNYYSEQKLGSGFTGENSANTVTSVIEENERIVSTALNDLKSSKLDTSAYTPSLELWVSGTGENAVILKDSNSIADGDFSVAEGSGTTASGNVSHAEGQGTLAQYQSHAEGVSSSAISVSHAEGQNTFAQYNSHSEGAGTSAVIYSHAEGQGTVAQYQSHAEGESSSAISVSHAEGQSTFAQYNSHTEGQGTSAITQSHAEGGGTMAEQYSHAEGGGTKAAYYSHTEGQGTLAQYKSHAEGESTIASGNSSHAEGKGTKAFGNYSHAEGESTTASGTCSHAEGYNTTANNAQAHAEGGGTLASGQYSHAEGNSSRASGDMSHAEGNATAANGMFSHSEGVGTTANGIASHAEGQGTTANGIFSHVEGDSTITNNDYEHASGRLNISSSASTTFGDSGNTLFSVGNGTSARHNAFEIRQNGDIYIVSGGTDILLQDHLGGGGGSITVDQVLDDTVSASTNAVSSKAVYKAVTDNELVWTNAYVTMSGAVSSHTSNNNIHLTQTEKSNLHTHTNKVALDSITGSVGTMAYQNADSYSSATQVNTALGNKANSSDLNAYADSVKFNGTNKHMEFYHGTTAGTKVFEFDATDFIVDGMVEDVRIEDVAGSGSCLVVDFNTASGKEDINIPIRNIFDASNYYDKTAIDNKLGSGFTVSSVTQVIESNERVIAASLNDLNTNKLDASAYTPTDLSNYYTKSETSGKTEISTALGAKVNSATFTAYTAATNAVLSDKQDTSGMTAYTTTATTNTLSGIITAHTADTTIHVTSNEKTTWNSKQDALTIDNTIGSSTSASTNPVSTSAVYGFITANTPIVDQVINSSTSASTNAVSTKAVWDIFEENEEIISASLNDLNGRFDDYYKQNETSGKTEISNALSVKTDSSAFTSHTSSSVHMSSTEKANLDSLATNITTISGITSTDRLEFDTLNRRTRKNFTSSGLTWFTNTLKSAIADQNLEKYGLKVGDYVSVTHGSNTYNYVIAGLNTMKGTSTPYRLSVDHVGIIVDTNCTHAWNASNSTSTSSGHTLSTVDGTTWSSASGAAYANCDLHYYLMTTILPNVKTDLGSSNIKSHYKLYSTAVNTSGYNRFGNAGGCSSSWGWYPNQQICALSEVQVYGSIIWSSSGYDTGEACRQLDVFRTYNMNEIFEYRYPWLRDVASSSYACFVNDGGRADNDGANGRYYVAALILFA